MNFLFILNHYLPRFKFGVKLYIKKILKKDKKKLLLQFLFLFYYY